MKKIMLALCCFLATAGWAQTLPYQNPNLGSEQRAKDLVSRLTLKEKAILMHDESDAIPRLGIKKFHWWSEALHGFANQTGVTVFPEPIGMAATFNDGLIYTVFNAVSDETRAHYNMNKAMGKENNRFAGLSVWTPNINIFRDPRWGRGQETYGEDPYLTSRMGVSVVKGLQGPENTKYKKLLACAKHFAVHSGPEWSRHSANLNNIEPRDLWETYLPAFKELVQKAGVREVMCAYQRLDDEPCCGNSRLLQQILRNDWGFKYIVVSDCGALNDFWRSHKSSSDATHAAAKGALAGTDVECSGSAYDNIPEAVAKGLVSEKNINEHVIRLMTGRFDLGEMDNDELVSWTKISASVINSKEHQQLALETARQTMTLLMNKNNILPMKKSVKKIAVIGPNANEEKVLWGNYNGTPVSTISILKGIEAKVGKNKIIYDKGCDWVEDKVINSIIDQCNIDGQKGIKATFWNNAEFKGTPVANLQIKEPINVTTMGQYTFAPKVSNENFSAIYETVYKPTESGEKVFRMDVFGRAELSINGTSIYRNTHWWSNLSSRIPYNFEKGKEYKIELKFNQSEKTDAGLKLDFGSESPIKYDELITKVKKADLVIFVGGLSSRLEGEEMPITYPGFKGGDRTDIELPVVQRNCLKALKEAGKKVILVNCSGSAIAFESETESCQAILQAWYPGEKGGTAVADVLFGDYNPAGKLPVTFYKNSSQLPNFEDYSMKGRTYRYMKEDPLFPFGYGLSYTTFKVGTAKAVQTTIKAGDDMTLTVPVANTGKRDGAEVIQVYIHKSGDSEGPIKTLRAFKRVDIKAGKSVDVNIPLDAETFQCYNPLTQTMEVAPGKYELMYGTSSDMKDLKTLKVNLQ